jgi:hypothetical protein
MAAPLLWGIAVLAIVLSFRLVLNSSFVLPLQVEHWLALTVGALLLNIFVR